MASSNLRFLRALALLSSATALSCGGKTSDQTGASDTGAPTGDTSSSDDATSDDSATTDAGAEIATGDGVCHLPTINPIDVPCPAGGTCVFPVTTVNPTCTPGTGAVDGSAPCGSIACAEDCFCSDPSTNTCFCTHAVTGPLPPPDLPALVA